MKINSINSNINFGKVFAVAGTKEQILDLQEEIKKEREKTENPAIMMLATQIYRDQPSYGVCTKAVQNGDHVAFVITGKEDVDKVSFMERGWTSLNGISHHIEKFIDLLKNKDEIPEILKAINENK